MRTARPYQLEAKEAIKSAFIQGKKGVAIELFTGAGKGYIIADIARDVIAKKGRALVLVNRNNLCDQLRDSLIEQGLYPQLERGLDKASPLSDLVVGSIPTMQGERLRRWNPGHFKLVITDEAHFAAAKSFKTTLDYFQASYHLFLTATLERHDKQGLWSGVTDLVYSMPLMSGIDQGWLVPFVFEELPVPILLEDKLAAKKSFTEKDEENLFSRHEYLPRLFAESAARMKNCKGLNFWPNCDSSREAAKHFALCGIDTMHVDGYMPDAEIAKILAWFREPGPKVLQNSELLSYGYDNPSIDTVGIFRVSKSIPMLKQRLGRGTRPLCRVDDYDTAEARKNAIAASAKPHCRVLDLMLQLDGVENTFADPTCLITEDSKEREFIREENRKAGRPLNVEEMKNLLKVKRITDKDAQLAKLAEDAANAAERKKKKPKLPYISDIIYSRNPDHKIAGEGFVQKARKLGFVLPEQIYSCHQIYRILERYEKNKQP